jgi:hypothetical protein
MTTDTGVLERLLRTTGVAFVAAVGLLVLTLGYQLGAVIHGGEFDLLVVLAGVGATLTAWFAQRAESDETVSQAE